MKAGFVLVLVASFLLVCEQPFALWGEEPEKGKEAEHPGPQALSGQPEAGPPMKGEPSDKPPERRKKRRRGGRFLKGLEMLKKEKSELRSIQDRLDAKREKRRTLREAMKKETDKTAKQKIRDELKETTADILMMRMSLAEKKSRIAKRVFENALDRYIESEKELARLQEKERRRQRLERRKAKKDKPKKAPKN